MTAATQGGVEVVRPLGADARSESVLAHVPGFSTPMVLRILKADQRIDQEAFLTRTRALSGLSHASLLVPRATGTLRDGRPYVVTEHVEADTLAARTQVPIDALVTVGVDIARALGALHAGGHTLGPVTARDVILSRTPVLDASLAGLSLAGASPKTDVHALAEVLLAAGAAGADKGPFESTVRRTLQNAATAEALALALDELQSRWRARTAVSGSHPVRGDPAEVDLTGTVLGQYQLEKVIGEGAMGRVYLGRHHRIGRIAAVKVLKAEHAASTELVQRFIQEAQAVNAIRNEHIVEIYDFGEEPQPSGPARVFCVMELLEGRALSDATRDGDFTVRRVVKICQQIADALHAAHQLGVVHRDIKPENVFLHTRGGDAEFVKVLDFGVAKLLKPIGDLPKSGTQAGVVIGTPEYMAPEQALGAATDFRVDIYAVGLVLYELLSGTQPFTAETFGRLVVEITTKPPPPLPARTPWGEPMPPGLATIVLKCLVKEPEGRYPSAQALAQALEAFASGRVLDPALAPTDAEALAAVKGSSATKLIGAAVALVLLAAGGYFAWSSTQSPPAEPAHVADVPAPPTQADPQAPRPAAAPAKVWLEVATSPAGATVTRSDTNELLGRTPLKAEVAARDTLALKLELDGYQPEQRELGLLANASLSVDLKALAKPPADEPKKAATPKAGAKRKDKEKGPVSRDGTLDPFSQ